MTVAAMALMVQQNLVSIEITGLPVRAAVEEIAKLTGTDLRVRDEGLAFRRSATLANRE